MKEILTLVLGGLAFIVIILVTAKFYKNYRKSKVTIDPTGKEIKKSKSSDGLW